MFSCSLVILSEYDFMSFSIIDIVLSKNGVFFIKLTPRRHSYRDLWFVIIIITFSNESPVT
ncbi:hypothetical protein BpHYR1_001452 [Brachionus plicatilis]|uniref:Uncharacterized protein n=1 Tax=Brachionus plicatilis TaxID=10195 RepID=A0A3M7T4E0_BRAPC|nr:hypothetical protein BpHYR1_001452 [Brachionus plicatilis]